MSELSKIVENAIAICKKHGAQDAFVASRKARSSGITWRKGQIETIDNKATLYLSLDLYVDGRFSTHTSNDMRTESLEAFIKRGIELTRLLEPDPHRGLADPKRYENRSTLDLQNFDPKIENLETKDLVEYCKACENAAYAHKDVPIFEIINSASMVVANTAYATTNGFSAEVQSSASSASCSCTLDEGDGGKPNDYGYSRVQNLEDLSSPESVAKEAVQYAKMRLSPIKLESKQRTLLILNRVVPRLLGHFLGPLSGLNISTKRSYFIDKIGSSFGSELLSLRDMPLIPRALGSRHFDNEGMSTVESDIFDKGVLKQYFLSNYYARKLGLDATSASYSNLVLPKGDRSLEALIGDIKDGILVTSLLGGNYDRPRGDFSYGIVGVAIENGELTTPISEMTITGNYTDFWTKLSEVANDPYPYSDILTPSVRIDGVSVSGK